MNRLQTIVIILVGVAAAWWLLDQAVGVLALIGDVLAIFGFAWLLNLLLDPLVERMSRYIPRSLAWGIGYIGLLLALIGLSAPLASQASALPAALPGTVERFTVRIDDFLNWLRAHEIAVPPSTARILESGVLAEQIGPVILSWSLGLLSVGGQVLLVIGVAAAMSAGDDSLRSIVRAALPPGWVGPTTRLYDDVRRTYAAAIRGQLAIWALGMALSLGVMFLFNTPGTLLWIGPLVLIRLLPYLGGILGGALTVAILMLSLPWPDSILPTVLVIVGQNVMGYIIEPRLLGRVLRLSPGLVLFVVLVGWKLGGITGIAFGVPAVAVVQALAERIVSRREFGTGRLYETDITPPKPTVGEEPSGPRQPAPSSQ
ncbi:MAG: AI-2E family transporter [Oscillochloris sp.]|nr:AI-2E family transporter [Oscillochloris sp.]